MNEMQARGGSPYTTLVTDYDQTLTDTDHMTAEMIDALRDLKASGCKLVLVTGRTLPYLYGPDGILERDHIELFDRVVCENGAVMWNPATDRVTLLGAPPSPELVRSLRMANVDVVVGWASIHVRLEDAVTHAPLIEKYDATIHGIEGAGHLVLVSRGINKATGMRAALGEIGVAPGDAVATGDGLNDIAMLTSSRSGVGLGIAVANADPRVIAVADRVTRGCSEDGVREVITALVRGQIGRDGIEAVA